MIRIGLLGARGRMGRWVTQLLESDYATQAKLSATASQRDPLEPLLDADVVIDFSSPAAMLALAETALKRSGHIPAFVVGSTGWKPEERRKLEELARKAPVLIASNFSTGVLALVDILKQAAPTLQKLGYTPVISEAHHRHKKDAPSGTAVTLQRAIAGDKGAQVQTHSVRAGEVIGDHEVSFYGPGDHIVIGHFAQDRSIFARGAIDVALWLVAKKSSPHGQLLSMDLYFEELKKR